MRADDLALFQSPLLPGEDLRFDGDTDGDTLLEGVLSAAGHVVGYVREGIPSFVAPNHNSFDSPETRADLKQWVPRNWAVEYEHSSDSVSAELVERMAATDGIMLEIACGPGGGFTPRVLRSDPARAALMQDVSIQLMHVWREFLAGNGGWSNVLFAAYDACQPVLRSESVDAISSAIGFSSTPDADAALRCAYDALVPGGLMYMSEIVLGESGVAKLPEPEAFLKRFGLDLPWVPRAEKTGFHIEDRELVFAKVMDDPEDGAIANESLALGVTLEMYCEDIVARKPA